MIQLGKATNETLPAILWRYAGALFFVSTGYFGLAFTMLPPPLLRIHRFSTFNALSGKLHQLASSNLQDIFNGR